MAEITIRSLLDTFGGPQTVPMVGANVDGKPNFMAHAWRGCLSNGSIIGLWVGTRRYTHKGITQNMTFSVNLPSIDQAKETDYCGTVSGDVVPNKAEIAKLKIFYGKLGTAPLIEQCPVNIECVVEHILGFDSNWCSWFHGRPHSLVIGRVEEVHVSEEYLTDGKPDLTRINPIYFSTGDRMKYHLYQAVGIHPDDPQALVDITMCCLEHHGFDGQEPLFGTDKDKKAPTGEFSPETLGEMWEVGW